MKLYVVLDFGYHYNRIWQNQQIPPEVSSVLFRREHQLALK